MSADLAERILDELNGRQRTFAELLDACQTTREKLLPMLTALERTHEVQKAGELWYRPDAPTWLKRDDGSRAESTVGAALDSATAQLTGTASPPMRTCIQCRCTKPLTPKDFQRNHRGWFHTCRACRNQRKPPLSRQQIRAVIDGNDLNENSSVRKQTPDNAESIIERGVNAVSRVADMIEQSNHQLRESIRVSDGMMNASEILPGHIALTPEEAERLTMKRETPVLDLAPVAGLRCEFSDGCVRLEQYGTDAPVSLRIPPEQMDRVCQWWLNRSG